MCTQKGDDRECNTVDEVAAELHTTPLRVLMLIKEKSLKGEFADGKWLVTRKSLNCFMASGADLSLQASCHTSCSSSGCSCK
jgi:hypothetical protein